MVSFCTCSLTATAIVKASVTHANFPTGRRRRRVGGEYNASGSVKNTNPGFECGLAVHDSR
eukprot:scaffold88465_cov63-Phaeocystis_antarctica.AAC.1